MVTQNSSILVSEWFFLNLFIKIYFFKVFFTNFFSVLFIYFSLNLFNMKIVFATTRNLIQN